MGATYLTCSFFFGGNVLWLQSPYTYTDTYVASPVITFWFYPRRIDISPDLCRNTVLPPCRLGFNLRRCSWALKQLHRNSPRQFFNYPALVALSPVVI